MATDTKSARRTLTLAEAAVRSRVKKYELMEWVNRGAPATKRADGAIRVNAEELMDWADAQGLASAVSSPSRKKDTGSASTPEGTVEASTRSEWDRRKARALALKYESELQRMRGELVKAEHVKRLWTGVAARLRNALESLGGQLAPRIVGLDPRAAEEAIDAEVRRRIERACQDGRRSIQKAAEEKP